ncbi:hypothetical protein [Treponema phagedenis]|uniref:hypothetical protein n=1 Tax=Treponema phagedenis TaxID=162 RepID=UPI0021CCB321|nr:hypothetical protein [Treponema phagedenis]
MKLNVCGGCNAKIAAGSLEKILESIDVFNRKEILEGFSGNEDAAVIKLSDEIAVVLTADFFSPNGGRRFYIR